MIFPIHSYTCSIKCLCSRLQGASPKPSRAETLTAGVVHLKENQRTLEENLANFDGDDTDAEAKMQEIRNQLELTSQCIKRDDAAAATANRLEEKMMNSPKRPKLHPPSGLTPPKLTQPESVDDSDSNVLNFNKALTFSEVIQTMSHNVHVYVKLGKVPKQCRDGTSNSKSFSFIKVEVVQPGATVRFYIIAWGSSLAGQIQSKLEKLQDDVIEIQGGKYEYSVKYKEHQIKIFEKSRISRVENGYIRSIFEDCKIPETYISKISEESNNSRVKLIGFVKTCDERALGPSMNNTYWRSFELADSSGCLVKGMAWGPTALQAWTTNVTVEMNNVCVHKEANRIQLDESSVVEFKPVYDLSPEPPIHFKALQW